jgi:hypothetical protein
MHPFGVYRFAVFISGRFFEGPLTDRNINANWVRPF